MLYISSRNQKSLNPVKNLNIENFDTLHVKMIFSKKLQS